MTHSINDSEDIELMLSSLEKQIGGDLFNFNQKIDENKILTKLEKWRNIKNISTETPDDSEEISETTIIDDSITIPVKSISSNFFHNSDSSNSTFQNGSSDKFYNLAIKSSDDNNSSIDDTIINLDLSQKPNKNS